MEMIRRSGQQGVPVITTDDDVIVGFDQVRLAKIAERMAGPKRPPFGLLAANTESYFARHPEAAATAPPGTKGVYVGEVRSDSVAARAGLRPGDILIGLAGKRIRDVSMLDQMVETLSAGDRAEIRYIRSGNEETATLQF
jgi:S1-C subfamily serine protease